MVQRRRIGHQSNEGGAYGFTPWGDLPCGSTVVLSILVHENSAFAWRMIVTLQSFVRVFGVMNVQRIMRVRVPGVSVHCRRSGAVMMRRSP
jgi:hypothetical protein